MAICLRFPALAAILLSGSILQAQPVLSQVGLSPLPAIEPVEFDGSVNFTEPPSTIGYSFSVLNSGDFSLTHLGVINPAFNGSFNGLIDPVQVGLWSSTGSLLQNVTIPAQPPPFESNGISDSIASFSAATVLPPSFGSGGAYFWSPLETPQILAAGDYTIGAFFSNQTYFEDGTDNPDLLNFSIFNTFQYAQQDGVAFGGNRLSFDEGFTQPTFFEPADGCAYFGPIFAGTYSGAPDPSSTLQSCDVVVEPPPPIGEGTEEDPFLPGEVDDQTGGFVFNFGDGQLDEDDFFFFDPEIAIGYVYRAVNALFDELEAPILPFNSSYNLLGSNDGCSTFTEDLLSGAPLIGGDRVVLTTPQECFRIDGIDIANLLDPADTTAFITGASLTNISGPVTITQNPITTFVPPMASVPGPLPVIGGVMALGWSRRLRRRIKQANKYRL